jgi:fructosamine-3-kinase
MREFVKTLAGAPDDFFVAEAAGLDRIRVAGGPPVPVVRDVSRERLVLDRVETGAPSVTAARDFGQRLARLHQAGDARFGADADGYVATIPLDNTRADEWPAFYAEQRIRPALAWARDRSAIDAAGHDVVLALIDRLPELAGPPEHPGRIHGDLWAGNLLWGIDGQVWLIDAAAACDGHRETDLAMLGLFGAPYLEEIVSSYAADYPLAAGWQRRVPLHQLHPLLVHAALFGGGYGRRAVAAARSLLVDD